MACSSRRRSGSSVSRARPLACRARTSSVLAVLLRPRPPRLAPRTGPSAASTRSRWSAPSTCPRKIRSDASWRSRTDRCSARPRPAGVSGGGTIFASGRTGSGFDFVELHALLGARRASSPFTRLTAGPPTGTCTASGGGGKFDYGSVSGRDGQQADHGPPQLPGFDVPRPGIPRAACSRRATATFTARPRVASSVIGAVFRVSPAGGGSFRRCTTSTTRTVPLPDGGLVESSTAISMEPRPAAPARSPDLPGEQRQGLREPPYALPGPRATGSRGGLVESGGESTGRRPRAGQPRRGRSSHDHSRQRLHEAP